MRIALVVPYFYYQKDKPRDIASGLVVYTHGLARALIAKHHKVTVLISDQIFNSQDRVVDGVTVKVIQSVGSDLAWSENVSRWLRENPQDVVEAHQWLGPLMVEQLIGGTPTVVRFASDLLECVKAGRYESGDTSRQEIWSEHLLDMLTVSNADLVICGGKKMAIRAEGMGSKIVLELPLGTDRVKLDKKKLKDPHVLVKVDRFMDPRKGGEFTYPILARIPKEIPVIVMGSDRGIDSGEMIKNSPREATWIFKTIPEEEVSRLYQECCCVVVPTKSESFGLSLLEPLKFGKPVICFDQDDPSKASWPLWRLGPVTTRSFDNLPKAIASALKPEKYLAQNLHDFASKFFWDNLVEGYEQAYRMAIATSLAKGRTRGW